MELQSWDQPWSLRYWKHVVLETIFLNVHFSNLEASYSFRNRLLATFLLGTPHLPVLLVEQVWTFPLWWRPLSSGYSFQRPLYWLQAAWVSSVLPNLWWVICLPLQCHRFVNNNLSKTWICLWLFDLNLLWIIFFLSRLWPCLLPHLTWWPWLWVTWLAELAGLRSQIKLEEETLSTRLLLGLFLFLPAYHTALTRYVKISKSIYLRLVFQANRHSKM